MDGDLRVEGFGEGMPILQGDLKDFDFVNGRHANEVLMANAETFEVLVPIGDFQSTAMF